MIITTMDDGLEFVKDRKYAHLVCGASPVFTTKTKRFREGEGAKLFETLKRFVSSSAFDVILVTNADKMLADAGSDALTWILDHAENDDSMTLVLSGIDENLIKIK